MGVLRRGGGDAPRVVGFDFSGMPPAAPPPVPAAPPPPPPPPAPVREAPVPAYAAAAEAPPAFAPPPPPGYETPRQAEPEVTHWRPGLPPPASWGTDAIGAPPAKTRSFVPSVRGIGSLVAFALVLAGGYRTWNRYFGEPFSKPGAIGDYALMTDGKSVREAAGVLRDVENLHRGIAGFYGANGIPAMLLVAGDANDDDAESLYTTFRDEGRSEGVTISRAVPYGDVLCASMTGFAVPGVVCFWGSEKSDGLVIHVNANDLDEAGRLTQLAWDAVEA